MTSRDAILGDIAKALGRGADGDAGKRAVEERIRRHPPNLVPARADLDRAGRVDLFEQLLTEVDATVERVDRGAEVPAALAGYLRAQNLPQSAARAPDPRLDAVPWDREPHLELRPGLPRPQDEVGVTGALGAVAETGTLMLTSGPDSPTSLNFLPETHVVVLWADQIAGSFEAQWETLRARYGEGEMPRTVNFITGPSRSADIEQTLQLGAHGPRRLHVILVDEPAPQDRA